MPGSNDEVTDRLLKEGSRSYLRAATALAVFEHEVQKRCQAVLAEHLEEVSSAIGIQPSLASSEIKPIVHGHDSGHEWRSVGVELVRKGIPVGIRYWGFYCVLYWEEEYAGIYATVCEWLGPRRFAETLGSKFQKLNSGVWRDGKEIGLSVELKIDEAAAFEKSLESLLRQWTKLWKQVGGMKGAFK